MYKRFLDIMMTDNPYLTALLETAVSANTCGATLRITMASFQAAEELHNYDDLIKKAAAKGYGHSMNIEIRGPR